MSKRSANALVALALLSATGSYAGAMPQWAAGGVGLQAGPVRLAYSPLPPKFRQGAGVLLIRDVRQSGGGCWNHCYNTYDECLGISAKNICLAQIKTCMETCDKLSGITNPVRRANDNQ
jgi:hypothetical protein